MLTSSSRALSHFSSISARHHRRISSTGRVPRAVFLAALFGAPVCLARAQGDARVSAAVDFAGMVQRNGIERWQPASRLTPDLRLDDKYLRLSGGASIVGGANTLRLDRGEFIGMAAPAPFGPFRLSLTGHGEQLTSSATRARGVLSLEPALSLGVGDAGAWIGTGIERFVQAADSTPVRPLLRFGVWRTIGGVTLTASTASHAARLGGRLSTIHTITYTDSIRNDTLGGYNYFQRQRVTGDSGSSSRTRIWSELEFGLSWARGPVALDAAVGARRAVDAFPRALWGRASAAVQLNSRVALLASAGNEAARIAMGIPDTRVATLGLRVSPVTRLRPPPPAPIRASATAFVITPVGVCSYVVTLHVPRARSVELSGDFGKWEPVALTETSPDTWETTLTLPPGTYRVNLRVDGDRWKAPPGLAVVEDEFNGTVGMMVVRGQPTKALNDSL
ncbi:MAG: glycogen-binding domain-containing protein [bacterium]